MPTATGKQLVEWTERDFPGRTPGHRVAHTVGIGAQGTFTPSAVIADFSVADQFQSGSHEVLVRFSNGSGLSDERDLHTDARGLAVKFFRGAPNETDMVAMTLPVFFVSTGAAFEGFSEASIPVPVGDMDTTWWQRLKMMLQLKVPAEPPPPDVERSIDPAHLIAYAREHPEAKSGVAALAGLINPISYARACYHGVHAFMMTGPDGQVRPVRYQWEPYLGVRGITDEERTTLANDHLHTDLTARLAEGSIRFSLQIMIGEAGDDVRDPTTPWPVQRRRISAGMLDLTAVVDNQETDQELVSYNPARLHHGFDVSPDDLLASRKLAYEYSCGQRHGSGCPVLH